MWMSSQQNGDRIAHLCWWVFYTTSRNITYANPFKPQYTQAYMVDQIKPCNTFDLCL